MESADMIYSEGIAWGEDAGRVVRQFEGVREAVRSEEWKSFVVGEEARDDKGFRAHKERERRVQPFTFCIFLFFVLLYYYFTFCFFLFFLLYYRPHVFLSLSFSCNLILIVAFIFTFSFPSISFCTNSVIGSVKLRERRVQVLWWVKVDKKTKTWGSEEWKASDDNKWIVQKERDKYRSWGGWMMDKRTKT